MASVLPEIALVCAPTMRSRAYVQALSAAGLLPQKCFLLPGPEPAWEGLARVRVDLRGKGTDTVFEPGKALIQSLADAGTDCVALPSADINAQEVLAEFGRHAESVLIYSGFGGALLRAPAFRSGKRFLHIHGGYLPDYRGSTAFYFSILKEGTLGASAIWLDQGIDTGPVLARRRFPIVPGLDVDRLGDPLVRADLLVEVMRARTDNGVFPDASQDAERGTTFHVIHPVLKHLALRRCKLVTETH